MRCRDEITVRKVEEVGLDKAELPSVTINCIHAFEQVNHSYVIMDKSWSITMDQESYH